MKFCYECGQTTPGQPRFCHSCGRSFDKKICPRFHENPRWAESCAHCGSRELSTPQRKIFSGWRLLEWLTKAVAGLALTFLTAILGLGVLDSLLEGRHGIQRLFVSASLLTLLWCFWTSIPSFFRRLVRKSFLRRRRDFLSSWD